MGAIIVLAWIVIAAFCSQIATNKGRSGFGWGILGLIFGPLALLFIALAGADTVALDKQAVRYGEKRRCPHCAEVIQLEASLCPHCRSAITPMERTRRIPLEIFLIGFFAALFAVFYVIGTVADWITSTFGDHESPPSVAAAAEPSVIPPTDSLFDPAPDGAPRAVARAAIKDAGHPCDAVISAERDSDGYVRAKCGNGEAYLIFREDGKPRGYALRCSVQQTFGNSACPWAKP